MKFTKTLCATLLASSAYTGIAQAADVVIGVPNWPSARVTANVLKVVIEDNLGLEVELQNGTNPVIFEAMDKGAVHVHPEVWLPPQSSLHDKFVKEKGTVRMNPHASLGGSNICTTKDTVERTGIKKLSELSDPEMAKKFDTDGDGKGEVWIGATGWASTNAERVRAKSYGYAETMELRTMDETLALAEVDNAESKKENIVFYCYKPHYMYAAFNIVELEEPPHNPDKWNVIQPTDDPDWLEKSTTEGAWKEMTINLHYASALEAKQPEAAKLLSNVKFSSDLISEMTHALVVEKQDAAEYAKKWVSENSSLVDSWQN